MVKLLILAAVLHATQALAAESCTFSADFISANTENAWGITKKICRDTAEKWNTNPKPTDAKIEGCGNEVAVDAKFNDYYRKWYYTFRTTYTATASGSGLVQACDAARAACVAFVPGYSVSVPGSAIPESPLRSVCRNETAKADDTLGYLWLNALGPQGPVYVVGVTKYKGEDFRAGHFLYVQEMKKESGPEVPSYYTAFRFESGLGPGEDKSPFFGNITGYTKSIFDPVIASYGHFNLGIDDYRVYNSSRNSSAKIYQIRGQMCGEPHCYFQLPLEAANKQWIQIKKRYRSYFEVAPTAGDLNGTQVFTFSFDGVRSGWGESENSFRLNRIAGVSTKLNDTEFKFIFAQNYKEPLVFTLSQLLPDGHGNSMVKDFTGLVKELQVRDRKTGKTDRYEFCFVDYGGNINTTTRLGLLLTANKEGLDQTQMVATTCRK